jgi:hypothetical protein
VYERTLRRSYLRRPHRPALQGLQLTTRLISSSPAGAAGDGPSSGPSIGQAGDDVAFQTTAANLLPGCANGHVQIVERAALLAGAGQMWCVSRSRAGGLGTGDSEDPSVTDAGQDVYFDTDAANLQPLGRQGSFSYSGARDVVSWDRKLDDIRLIQSLAWNNTPSVLPAQMGNASSRGNYVLFTSTDSDLDPLDAGVSSVSVQVPIGCGGVGARSCPTASSGGSRAASSGAFLNVTLPTVTIPIPGLGDVTVTDVTLYDVNNSTPQIAATTAPTQPLTLTPQQASPIEVALGAVFPLPSSQQVYLRYVGPNVPGTG